MDDIVKKISDKIKGRCILIAAQEYTLEFLIESLSWKGGFHNVHLKILQYIHIIEAGNEYIIIDGLQSYPLHSILNIYNSLIREELHRILKHYGVTIFTYEVLNTISYP